MEPGPRTTRRSLTIFFMATFAATWAIWSTTIGQQRGWWSFHVPQALAFWIGLFLVTYVVAFATDGRAGISDLLERATRWRVGPGPYALAIGIPILISAFAYLITSASNNAIEPGSELHLAAIPALLIVSLWLFLLTEETAWRGYALPRIQALTGDPLRSGVILGVIWAIWHVPLFFITDSFQSDLPFLGFACATVATSVLVTWIFDLSRGSVLICAIFHTVTDTSLLYFDVMSNAGAFWITASIQVIVGGFAAYRLRTSEIPMTGDLVHGT